MPLRPRNLAVLALVLASASACSKKDPLYCDPDTPCTDPDLPFCDHNGEYPASDGIKHTCIPDPFPDAGPDAGGPRRVVDIAVGLSSTCAVLNDGGLRCWGSCEYGACGYPDTDGMIGDNEHPYELGDVPTGGPIKQVALGQNFKCALYVGGNVRCWGLNLSGQLGYGDTINREGPDYTPDKLDDVELNGSATYLAAGREHICAVMESGDVRCWGSNFDFQAATGDTENIGDDEVPGSRSPIPLGRAAVQVSASHEHNCAILEGDFVRCWGTNASGPLGYGSETTIGDDETPASAGDVDVGGRAVHTAVGLGTSCVLLSTGNVRCWGNGDKESTIGVLGYQETEDIGDDESPASAGDLTLGDTVEQIFGGSSIRCALLEGGVVRCWGYGEPSNPASGLLGQGDIFSVGDNEFPADVPPVDLGGTVVRLGTGFAQHECALLDTGAVRCWGWNHAGQLGLGVDEAGVGDDELPSTAAEVRVLDE
jgi:alpha-tubulin suppressor-like RCC1 family protein